MFQSLIASSYAFDQHQAFNFYDVIRLKYTKVVIIEETKKHNLNI